ncbi:AI-2E family transporter [Snodgrassella sp. B3882]|uniref:AI-2E family transporter n=1 Tax=Snodgrassella sp. B3882 TaxID=2818037 RepID=UPI002269C780|nr:AI-2E family transporter [Snodgrassella sp. B3882]MCX8744539.1 AI-2E family transporter [Snodgrassella sp. B3882]
MNTKKSSSITPWIVGGLVLILTISLFIGLKSILMPFAAAGVLAYILNPIVEKLTKHKIPRTTAAMLVMLLGLSVIIILLLIVIPMLINLVDSIYEKLPDVINWIHLKLLPWLNQTFHINIRWDADYMMRMVTQWIKSEDVNIKDAASKVLPVVWQQGSGFVEWVTNLMLFPFLLYYFLLDWSRWTVGISDMIPRRILPTYQRIMTNMDTILGAFLRGELLVMIIMGLVYGIGLALVGLQSGFAIGMIAGLLVFIPYLGAFTGLLLATLAALLQFHGWTGLFMVWGVFAIGQFLESFLVTPKIVGDRIGLSPFWVIFSLMAFGQLLGFVGMLLALPLAAICLVLVREGTQAYKNSHYYRQQPDNAIIRNEEQDDNA